MNAVILVDEDLLTPKEVAEKLRVTDLTLYNWRKAGKGPPYVRLENTIRYPRTGLEQYLRENFIAPAGPSSPRHEDFPSADGPGVAAAGTTDLIEEQGPVD